MAREEPCGRRQHRAVIDAVVTHHTNTFRSGVARFNEIMAEQVGVPLVALFGDDAALAACAHPLLSFKVSEMDERERDRLGELLPTALATRDVFAHDWIDTPLEHDLVAGAVRVLCGNHAVLEVVSELHPSPELAWSPGLMLDQRRYTPAEIRVFSFGMAHKIRTEMFQRLRELLDASGRSYAVYVSSANHETASIRDSQLVYDRMHEIFGTDQLYFMGNLSDVAIYNELQQADFFAAFFDGGARANNGSIAAAMENGAVVVTNLDEHSPPYYEHGHSVIDIERCDALPLDRLTRRRLSVNAMEAVRAHGWPQLAQLVSAAAPVVAGAERQLGDG